MPDGAPSRSTPDASTAPVRAILALGSNLGDRAATLALAVADLRTSAGIEVAGASPIIETDPVGGPDQPAYLNAVVAVNTTLGARELLKATAAIEARHGRRRDVRWGARTLDIDIITFGDQQLDDDVLIVPHPRARDRAFVLWPWSQLDPGALLADDDGVMRTVSELAGRASDRPGIHPRPDIAWEQRR